MATVQLPLEPSVPNYRVATTLSGVPYLLDVRWNGRAEAWFLTVLDARGVVIRAGIKIVLGVLLGWRVTDLRWPPGVFMAVDLSNRGIDARLDDLGTRVVVWYSPIEDL